MAAGRPLASPKWLMPWLRHAAPSGAEPRVVVVSDGGELIGIAPFVVQRGSLGRADYRLFGVPFTERREPLAREGRGEEVAAEVARVLGGASPRPSIIALEGIDIDSPWPDRLATALPGPAAARGGPAGGAPDAHARPRRPQLRRLDAVEERQLPLPDAPDAPAAGGRRGRGPDERRRLRPRARHRCVHAPPPRPLGGARRLGARGGEDGPHAAGRRRPAAARGALPPLARGDRRQGDRCGPVPGGWRGAELLQRRLRRGVRPLQAHAPDDPLGARGRLRPRREAARLRRRPPALQAALRGLGGSARMGQPAPAHGPLPADAGARL